LRNVRREITRDDFNLYRLDAIKATHNFSTLQVTRTRFDEPWCVSLIGQCQQVVAIHGCASKKVLIGGLDDHLKTQITLALRDASIEVGRNGHAFRGKHPRQYLQSGPQQ
jgi:phage replication-related protein YjqB (UPF0714/DUF867 family)